MYECAYARAVAQWAADKAAANLPSTAWTSRMRRPCSTTRWPMTMPDDDPEGERFVTLGMDALGRLFVVVYE